MTAETKGNPTFNVNFATAEEKYGAAPELKDKPTVGIEALMQIITYVKYIDDILANHTSVLNNLKQELDEIKNRINFTDDFALATNRVVASCTVKLDIHEKRLEDLELGDF